MTKLTRAEKIAARKASDARIAEAQGIARAALEGNCCPDCGAAVVRNLALTGWVMCARKGAPGFRKDPNGPSCDWQGFTR